MELPNGSGMFDELYLQMNNEIEKNYRNKREYDNANKMSLDEKQISFMNRYFVFRKTHNVNAEKVYKLLVNKNRSIGIMDDDDAEEIIEKEKRSSSEEQSAKETTQPIIIRKIPGKKKKIVIGIDETVEAGKPEITLKPSKVVIKRKK
jgi:hypothetical protein